MDPRCGSRAEAGQHGCAGWGGWGESARSEMRHGAVAGLAVTGEIGVAVALGVLLDTTVVRPVLESALTLDIGRHIWWPSVLANPESSSVTGGT
jgi:MMPL family